MRDLLDRTLGDGVKVTIQDWTTGWTLFGDRTQMENAILNLAVNARDAMDGRGELTIRTAEMRMGPHALPRGEAGDYVVLSVADTGEGMTPEVIERVFEPFFTTKPAGKGTGLGLSQIFGLVGQMGGDVTIQTRRARARRSISICPATRLPPGLPVEAARSCPSGRGGERCASHPPGRRRSPRAGRDDERAAGMGHDPSPATTRAKRKGCWRGIRA